MGEYNALEQDSCPACGAKATWSAQRQALICEFCGTEAPYEFDRDAGRIREIDLVAALRETPRERGGWQSTRRAVRCRSCDAISMFDAERVGQSCEFCGSSELMDYSEINAPIRPESLLPFKVSETSVRESMRRWFANRWFAPGRFKRAAALDTIRGIYLPYWTFDAQADCPWTAESGTYYYTTNAFTDASGKRRTRRVRQTRWRRVSGRVHQFFDDQPIPGTRGVDVSLLNRIEPFPTHELVLYDPGYLRGFIVEHYQVVLVDAARRAREAMNERLHELCARQIPGDTHRGLQIEPTYAGQTFKHILVPTWLLSYTFHGQLFQVLVNGYTGTIAGNYPKSWWKIAGLALGVGALVLLALAIRSYVG
ncbi:MAG: zinc ribbon domain-containing protein [bacterium]|nr:zinc ribbon domain-containing protein [bacterium]